MKSKMKYGLLLFFVATCTSLVGCKAQSQIAADAGVQVVNPPWAPAYAAGVRYYYLPDIEVYYDLANSDFVYLDNGQWLFSPTLPPMYSSYDLYTGFAVALNINVYQPWFHHQFYVSHYPRFYYRNFYPKTDIANIRGFNENAGKPVYWRDEDRNRIDELKRAEAPRSHVESRPPQEPHYYGHDIGHPVHVTGRMRESGRK